MSNTRFITAPTKHLCGRYLGLSMLLLYLSAGLAESATVTLAWNPNTESIAGYILSYGESSRQYTSTVDVGNATTFLFIEPDPTKVYYLAVQAYNTAGVRSPYSNEVWTTPVIQPLTVTNLAANALSPQVVGTTITFAATATGSGAPYQYKWWVSDGVTSTIGRNWSTSNTFAWTPVSPNSNYRITVWARKALSTVDNFDNPSATLSMTFVITAALPPTVSGIAPNAGPITGLTNVTITGTKFVSGAGVSFGGTPATNVVVVSATSITARTPAHAAGAVNVVVTNPNTQSGTLADGFTYTTGTQTQPIGFVQVAAAVPQWPVTTVTVPFAGAQTAGDLNIIVVGWNNSTSTVQSLSDTAGNVYSLAIGPTTGIGLRQSIYYAANIRSGSNTVTVVFNQPTAYPDIRILQYRGVSTLDVTAGASGNSAFASSGPATTTSPNELIFGANTIAKSTIGPGSGFTSRIITWPDGDIAEDRIVTATGTYSATAPLTSTGPWVMQMVTFKASTGTSSPPTVASVAPNAGPIAGGTNVTITGTNFVSGASVSFGGTPATNVVVVSATSITARTPAHAAGAVNVVVTNPNTQSSTLAGGFTYTTGTQTQPISFVQVAAAVPQWPVTTVTVPFAGAQTAGDLNIIVVGWNNSTSTVQSLSDTAGNVYSLAIGPTTGIGLRQSIYYAANIRGGSNTVTVVFNQPTAYPDIRILQYRGVSTLDVTAGASGNSAFASSGPATTTSPNELIFGANTIAKSTIGPGSGFTSRIITSPDGDIAEDRIVTATGTYSATAPLTSSGPWVMQMVTFK